MSCRRFFVLIIATVLFAGFCSSMVGANPFIPKLDAADSKNIMHVKDVRAGMKGYGLTVFRGTKIEKFNVEVLGVLKKINSGRDLIFIRMSGGPIIARGAFTVHGMSGSPVYINGKLIGAYAMGMAFQKEPLGLVTPIEDMLDAWDPALPSKASSFTPFETSTLDKPIALSGRSFGKIAIDNSLSPRNNYGEDTMVFRPLAMPMFVSGVSPKVLAMFQNQFQSLNLNPMIGGGSGTDRSKMKIDLVPGAGIGVSLITGDMDLSFIGTLTYRRGNKIVGFGHPMLGIGPIEAPLISAYVHDVLAGVQDSTKIADPVAVVGKLDQDRPWSIGGTLGKTAKMIPVVVHITDKAQGRTRDFNCQVASHPLLSRVLINIAAAEGLSEMRPTPTDSTARVKFEVVTDEVGTITRENTFFDPTAIESSGLGELEQLLSTLQMNQFHPVPVKKVSLWVDIDSSHPTAKLEKIFLKQTKFEPGDTIEIGAVLRPFTGEKVTRTISLKLPDNMPSGQMALQVGQPSSMGLMGMMGGMDASSMIMISQMGGGPSPSFENVQQLVKKFLEKDKNTDLVAKIVYPRMATSIGGEKFASLPPSMADAMRSSKSTPLGTDREEVKQVQPTDWVIGGSQRLIITVRKLQKGEKRNGLLGSPIPSGPNPPSAPPMGPMPGMDEMDGPDDTSANLSFVPLDASMSQAAIVPVASATITAKPEAAKTDEDKAKPTEDSGKDETATADKPVVRATTSWKQASKADFQTGTLKNALVTSADTLTSSGALTTLCESSESYIWCVLPDGNGNVYAGSGNHGIVYKVSKDGKATEFYKSPELEINSLAMDTTGNLYAGTSPNGIIYKIDPQGKALKFFSGDEKYLTALAFDSKGNLYAAVGNVCKVYKISPDGKSSTVLDVNENAALCLVVDKSDNVYVGTGLDGLVYKITPSGEKTVAYDAAEDSVTALAINSKGALYVGTHPKGMIYKLCPGANPKTIYDKAGSGITSISIDDHDNVYALNASGMVKVLADDKVAVFDNKNELQFLSSSIRGGQLYAGTGNVGGVYHVDLSTPSEATYESTSHDCGLTAKWGGIDWTADLPKGSSIALETRTGNASEPDSTWSGWSSPYTNPTDRITSPPARFIQYRAILKSDNSYSGPVLKNVSLTYLPANQAPKVTFTNPKGGEKWSKKQTIRWTGTDPDKDTLTYDVSYSADNGTTWTPIKNKTESNAKPEKNQPEKEAVSDSVDASADKPSTSFTLSAADTKRMMEEMNAELASHPEIPADVKDKILADATSPVIDSADDSPAEEKTPPSSDKGNGSTKQTNIKWDTTKVKDGAYLIKIVASDRLSNPTGALTEEVVSNQIAVVNKTPFLMMLKKTLTVQADKSVKVQGVTFQHIAPIAGVQYRIDSTGDWAAAASDDGIYDSAYEGFTIVTQPLDKGEHVIEVKTIDQAGNSATVKVKAKVE